ncbi:MAG TPA: hypothetical protein VGO00_21965 [Kofleriaceae bacterium]|nr:hypothetical protein [Kofleriaceae bacterium]
MTLARPNDELGAFDVELQAENRTITSLVFLVFMADNGPHDRQQTLLKRFGKNELTDEERRKGFVWRNYNIQILTNAKAVWSVTVSAR